MTLLALILPVGIIFLVLSALAVHKWEYYAFSGIVPVFVATAFFTAANHEFFVYLTSALIIGSLIGILFRGKRKIHDLPL